MVSRKWLFSYRILTARLREGAVAPAARAVGMNGKPAAAQPRSAAIHADLTEAQPGKRMLFLRAAERK